MCVCVCVCVVSGPASEYCWALTSPPPLSSSFLSLLTFTLGDDTASRALYSSALEVAPDLMPVWLASLEFETSRSGVLSAFLI